MMQEHLRLHSPALGAVFKIPQPMNNLPSSDWDQTNLQYQERLYYWVYSCKVLNAFHLYGDKTYDQFYFRWTAVSLFRIINITHLNSNRASRTKFSITNSHQVLQTRKIWLCLKIQEHLGYTVYQRKRRKKTV